MKNKAWVEMSREFKSSVSEIKRKIKHLRTAFVAEKKKVEASKKSGSSADLYPPCLFYYDEFRFLEEPIVLITTELKEDPDLLDRFEEDFEQGNGGMDIDQACEAFEFEGENLNEDVFTENGKSRSTQIKTLSNVAETPLWKDTPTTSKAIRTKAEKSATKATASKISSRYQDAISEIVGAVNQPPDDEDAYTAFGKSIALRLKQLPQLISAEAMLDLESIMLKHTRRALSSRPIEILANNIIRPASVGSDGISRSSSNLSNRSFTARVYSAGNSTSTLSSDILQTAMSDADIECEQMTSIYKKKNMQ